MKPQIMTSTDDRKIIDINGKPFIIPDNQLTDKSEMIKCEFYMLSNDLEFLLQDFLDSFAMNDLTAQELMLDKPLTFKVMEGCDEFICRDMADLYQRLYHYLKPFKKEGK
mgnify:CR=1 FL=1